MVCWLSFIFLVFYLRNFLYKGMLLPLSLRHMLNLQLSSLAFKIFLLLISLYLFASFLVIFFFNVLWDLFPDKILLLFVFVLQHSIFDLWVLTSNFTLVFMMHWCYPWHLSLKLYWLLSWQLSCFNTCLCNMATSTILTMKSWWLLCWQWSNTNTNPCNRTILALIFAWRCSTLVFAT